MIKHHKKIADEKAQSEERVTQDPVIVGKAYDFLFEGEDKEYDEEYSEYI